MNSNYPAAIKAGYDAYYAAPSIGFFGMNRKPQPLSPPYTQHPERSQWQQGWRIAQKNHETGGYFSYTPFVGMNLGKPALSSADKQAKQREFQRKQAEFKAKQKAKIPAPVVPDKKPVGHTPWRDIKRKFTTDAQAAPAVNLRRLDKFNKKHRTKV